MIEVRSRIIGDERLARELEAGPGAIRAAIKAELAKVGNEIVSRASSMAPKSKGPVENPDYKRLSERILWYFGGEASMKQRVKAGLSRFGGLDSDFGPIVMTARPTGTIAHLMERGVHGPRREHQRRLPIQARKEVWGRKGRRMVYTRNGRHTFMRPTTTVKAHPFHIAPRPFFMPAVASVGGAEGVNARLQEAINRVAQKMTKGEAPIPEFGIDEGRGQRMTWD